MSTPTSADALASAVTPMILPRLARTHTHSVGSTDGPVRLLLVGTAGSGKTRLLRQLVSQLADYGRDAVFVASPSDIPDGSPRDVLIVDDAHLAAPEVLQALAERLAQTPASVILAMRPTPSSPLLERITGDLERAQPAIVLGHLSSNDVAAHLDETGRIVEQSCIDEILEMTGHLTWLVSEALVAHDDITCRGGAHPEIGESLRDLIAHRMDTLVPEVRDAIIAASLADGAGAPIRMDEDAAAIGYAKGLLERNGRPAPVVADAIRATVPVDRLIEEYATAFATSTDARLHDLIGEVRHPRVAQALLEHGDRALQLDPKRASELYRGAARAGAGAAVVALRQARAAWARGEIDAAGAFVDEVTAAGEAERDAAATVAAAVWAARGDIALSDATFVSSRLTTVEDVAHATIAAVGAADAESLVRLHDAPAARAVPATLAVALELLTRGLRSSVTAEGTNALSDLVRSAEMYTASGTSHPICEIPAVIAAITAINLGDLAVAHTVLDDALRAGHAGAWAQGRLQLWQAWVALQRERPMEAEAAAQRAASHVQPTSPRDRLLSDAVHVALARRHGDTAALSAAWRRARGSILRARFDLFLLHPLGEFAVTAARVGESDRLRPHVDGAFASIAHLGEPPIWSAHLHWAGLHASILRHDQAGLAPHARALLAAGTHSRPAARMAQAGRSWTESLRGMVDVDAIEAAALGLAEVGLAWDGARLASYAAGRSEDRRVIGRLLACARQLHPREKTDHTDEATVGIETRPTTGVADVLSTREREVAMLVLQGKTYAEIGESIFISPRTAEHHIARIRRRLGATSRSDLISKLRAVMTDAAGERD